jgi:hypothetical protein
MEKQNKNDSVPENNCVFCNDGDGLHTFARRSKALVGVGILIVEVLKSHAGTPHKVDRL